MKIPQSAKRRSFTVVTLPILLFGGICTAAALASALGEPIVPLWLTLLALAAWNGIALVAGKSIHRFDGVYPWIIDVALAVVSGVAFMAMDSRVYGLHLDGFWRFVYLVVFVIAITNYLPYRHPDPAGKAGEPPHRNQAQAA